MTTGPEPYDAAAGLEALYEEQRLLLERISEERDALLERLSYDHRRHRNNPFHASLAPNCATCALLDRLAPKP